MDTHHTQQDALVCNKKNVMNFLQTYQKGNSFFFFCYFSNWLVSLLLKTRNFEVTKQVNLQTSSVHWKYKNKRKLIYFTHIFFKVAAQRSGLQLATSDSAHITVYWIKAWLTLLNKAENCHVRTYVIQMHYWHYNIYFHLKFY